MKTLPKPGFPSLIRRSAYERGFALVVTLALMVLIAILATGMLGLSAITLRKASVGAEMETARANARLALMLAIGELQKEMGPDTRVSAPASSVHASPGQPHLTGVWNSWRWDPAKSESPDYSRKKDGFRRWLVSTPEPGQAENFQFPASEPAGEPVEMSVVGAAGASVSASKIPVTERGRRGSIAWVIFDESTKASIHLAESSPDAPSAGEAASRTAPSRFQAANLAPQLGFLDDSPNLVSFETALIPAGDTGRPELEKRFHDLTTLSTGLLTDVAKGGLRTDLTQLFEAPIFPANAFQASGISPVAGEGSPTWRFLYDHYRKYKDLAGSGGGRPQITKNASGHTLSGTNLVKSPDREELLPVILRLQLVFSVVSHHAHIGNRVDFLNLHGVPKGNQNHAVPHLVYDPVITLFNPYDVILDIDKVRVRIWDPPVGFRFAKKDKEKGTTSYLRPEMANGEYHGLARLDYTTERNPWARKYFTLNLSDIQGSQPGKRITLQPGEVRIFSPWVNDNWTWGWETEGGYAVKAFFDYAAGHDLGNNDGRTRNRFGLESIPGWDQRAGLQTDHLAYVTRDPGNLYDFEKAPAAHGNVGGYPSLRLTDELTVDLKPVRTLPPGSSNPDFMVELLAAKTDDYGDSLESKYDAPRDLLRRYKFRFGDVTQEISPDPSNPVVSRTYRVSDILQTPSERGIGGKKCLAMLEMSALTTRDTHDSTKAWLYNNPVVAGADQDTRSVGLNNQSYDLRFVPLSGWSTFPIVEWDADPGPGYGRSYYGAGRTSFEGVSNVPMHHVPLAPAASLGSLIPANLTAGPALPRVVHPFGNSFAHPLLPPDKVVRKLDGNTLADHSYLLNDTLWDSFFFSSLTGYANLFPDGERSREDVIRGVLENTRSALNPRIVPAGSTLPPAAAAAKLNSMGDDVRARKIAASIAIAGAFNVNSVSEDAWRAVLSSLRDRAVTGWNNRPFPNEHKTPLVRMGYPLAGASGADADVNVVGQIRWAGYRALNDQQIESLAREIVSGIKTRGQTDGAPFLSLAEFVNRRPGPAGSPHSLAGIIQTAIDDSGINAEAHILDSKTVEAGKIPASRKRGVAFPEAMDGPSAQGAPSIISQGDIMAGIAGVATVRGDTFKIRAYGESISKAGVVAARAWCEAIVQRDTSFIDPTDPPETALAELASTTNETFGRSFRIVSFRWLDSVNPQNP